MTLHTNVITRLAVLLLLLGVVMAIGTPQVSAHHPPPAPHYSGPSDNNRGLNLNPPGQNMVHAPLRAAINAAINRNLGSNRAPQASVVYSDILNLTHLDLSDSGISYIKGLETMTRLTHLDLSGNSITDISPLSGLTHLTHLDLADNNLTDTVTRDNGPDMIEGTADDRRTVPTAANAVLKPLDALTNLELLKLSHNNIAVITALEGLTSLNTVTLHRNNIADFSPLASNTGIGTGDKVWLGANPFGSAFFNTGDYTTPPLHDTHQSWGYPLWVARKNREYPRSGAQNPTHKMAFRSFTRPIWKRLV